MNIELLLKKLSQQNCYQNSQVNKVSNESKELREHAKQLKQQIKKLTTLQSINMSINATPKSTSEVQESSFIHRNGQKYLPVTSFQYQKRREQFLPSQGILRQMGNASCMSYESFQKDFDIKKSKHNKNQKSRDCQFSCESKRSRISIGNDAKICQKTKDKHNLKPSSTPSFPKFTSFLKQSDRFPSHLSKQKILNKNIQQPKNYEDDDDNEEAFSYQIHQLNQSQQKAIQLKNFEKTQSYRKSLISNQGITNYSNHEHNQKNQQKLQNQHIRCNDRLLSIEENMKKIHKQFQERFRKVFKRLEDLQLQNCNLIQQNNSLREERKGWQQKSEQTVCQKQAINLELLNQRLQKEQLESILKQILFKRERQKLLDQKSKSTHIAACSNHKNAQKANKWDSKAQKSNKQNLQCSHQSKMKVQNLLQKLQIKVERV